MGMNLRYSTLEWNPATQKLELDGTALTSTFAELNTMDGVTSTAAELNILDGVTSTAAELNILDGVTSTTAELNILDGVTSTAAELNILDGVTATAAELNTLDGSPASVTTTATPASGSCAVQFVFKDAAGTTMAVPSAGTFYLSESADGTTVDAADTSVAVLTNGVVNIVDTGVAKYYNYVTSAAGLLGLTITAAADDYYVVFVKPNGLLMISTVCTANT
jgi:hypothetical protein